jgi:hypothetical protein
MISLNLYTSSQVLSPNIIKLKVRASTYELRGRSINIQFIIQPNKKVSMARN